MTCSTHIVYCLRQEGIQPVASASSQFSSSISASNALECDNNNAFDSASQKSPQWWKVDFKKRVSISSYEISTNTPASNDVSLYNWTLSVSDDDKNWRVIHGPTQSYSTLKSCTLNKPVNALYARIDGNSLYSKDNTEIWIRYVKFIGTLNPKNSKNACTCKHKRVMNFNLMRIILLLYS